MASLYITEYERMARDQDGNVMQCGEEPAVTSQKVTYTTSAASAALNKRTCLVRLKADADFHLKVGTAPAATASHPHYEANVEYFIGVRPGTDMKIAAYDGSS